MMIGVTVYLLLGVVLWLTREKNSGVLFLIVNLLFGGLGIMLNLVLVQVPFVLGWLVGLITYQFHRGYNRGYNGY